MLHKELVKIPRATLDFYKYEEDGLIFYEFDASECTTPEPMVNAMAGLALLENDNERLVGKFFHKPIPLLNRISEYFSYETYELESGDFCIVFKKSQTLYSKSV